MWPIIVGSASVLKDEACAEVDGRWDSDCPRGLLALSRSGALISRESYC